MLTRRSFLRRTAAASASLAFPAIVRARNLNSGVQIAVVGVDGQGLSDLKEIGRHESVKFVGFCDVDSIHFGPCNLKFPGVPNFKDFRVMFDKLGNSIDGVQVSTPDHNHAYISLNAMQRGKHVYCQKPLTQTVWESRQMRLQEKKSKVITQMGTQIHSKAEYRTAVRLIRDGAIGKIKAVHAWYANTGNHHSGLTARAENAEVPPNLDWDLWLGTAPIRPFADGYVPFKWRDWQDFGGGVLGDFGCHLFDPIFCALDLGAPKSILAENSGLIPEIWPISETISYIFPGTPFTADKVLPLTWHDGGRKPDVKLAQVPEGQTLPPGGSLFIGETGTMILPHWSMPTLYPVEKFGQKAIEKEPSESHYHLWVDAIISGRKTTANFQLASRITEAVQLGNVATRVPGKTLEWNTEKLRFSNSPEADKLISRHYRDGWSIKAVS